MNSRFGSFINELSENTYINTVLGNPIYTALMITVILVMMVLIIFRNVELPFSKYGVSFKIFIYTFIFTLIIVFLNNSVVIEDTKKFATTKMLPVGPQISGGYDADPFGDNEYLPYKPATVSTPGPPSLPNQRLIERSQFTPGEYSII